MAEAGGQGWPRHVDATQASSRYRLNCHTAEHNAGATNLKGITNMKLSDINYVFPVPRDLVLPHIVYKYRVANELLFQSLVLNQVWLAKPESFNDPFEPESIFSGTPFSKALDRDVRESGVLCLCKSSENLPMWSYYGDGLRGIAIGYDVTVLLSTLEPAKRTQSECSPRWKYLFDLDYHDDGLREVDEHALLSNDQLTDAERKKMFATKSRAFLHEEECRIVIQPSSDVREDFKWQGYGLYHHAPQAIKEIILGELISPENEQVILKVLEGRNITIKKAVRDKQNFSIQIRSI